MRKIVICLFGSALLSSCATVLNSPVQSVAFPAQKEGEILVDGEAPEFKKGKLRLKRDFGPKQIAINSDSLMEENFVLMQCRKSPLYYLSIVPFGIFFYPLFLDVGPKSLDYRFWDIQAREIPKIPKRGESAKNVVIKNIKIDVKKEDFEIRHYSYRDYVKYGRETYYAATKQDEKLLVENSVFSNSLNEVLREEGYIDTTNRVLTQSYLGNLRLNATVTSYTINRIRSRYQSNNNGMVIVDLGINWEVLDFYDEVIFKTTVLSSSGQFKFVKSLGDKELKMAIDDAVKGNFGRLLAQDSIHLLLNDKSEIGKEEGFANLDIQQTGVGQIRLSRAIKSAVTIKTKKGFGSGFILSEDGYIITNYHVVSDSTDLKIILNSNSEFKAEIVRKSKIYDLALLKIDTTGLTPLSLNLERDVELASDVYAVGTPTAEDLSQTITRGIISGKRILGDAHLLQTDASINSGNSGGPLLNKDGEVVGVVSSKVKGFGVEGVAFGIPAFEIIDRLKIRLVSTLDPTRVLPQIKNPTPVLLPEEPSH
ncbi:MAG: serine protease Do [Sphingobacteriales bacterium]|jgi:serine protease Do